MFKLLDRNIEWLVALAVVYITTMRLFRSLMDAFEYTFINRIISYSTIFLVGLIFLYQKKKFGVKVYDEFFWWFYLVYCLYIFLDITFFRRYPLDNMLSVPKSVVNYFYDLAVSLGYLLCAPTFYHKFNLKKYVFLSLMICTIPSVLFIQYIGLDMIQAGFNEEDENFIGGLSITFSNLTLLVIAVMNFKTIFRRKWMSMFFSSMVILSVTYILFAFGKRGPMLWAIVSIMACFFITSKNMWKYFIFFGLIGVTLIIFINPIIDGISAALPKTGQRLEETIKEGNTDGRFDLKDAKHSTYLIGIENFSRSPIWGYYFRLVTDYQHYQGAYSHNIFIEVLMTMGLLGFVPFMLLLLKAYKKSRKIFRRPYTTNQMAIFVLFTCPFLQLQTSNTIVFMYDFWLFFYMLCSLDLLARTKEKKT